MAEEVLRRNVVWEGGLDDLLGKPMSLQEKPYEKRDVIGEVVGPTDEDLVRRCQSGDNEAFGVLVKRHQNRIYRLICYTLGNRDNAEDLSQEAFLRAYQSIRSFRFKANFFTWIYRITVNVCLREMRRKKVFYSLEVGRSEPSYDEDQLGRMEKDEAVKQLYLSLDCLKEREKMVLVLREIEELSYDEIGRIMDYPLGTVKSAISRAREKLRHHLTGEYA